MSDQSMEPTAQTSQATQTTHGMTSRHRRTISMDGLDFGPYRLLGIVAQGGTGIVFKGQHRWIGRSAAIKMVNPKSIATDSAHGLVVSEASELIHHEASVLAAVHSPFVLPVFDAGTGETGHGTKVPYFASPLLEPMPTRTIGGRESDHKAMAIVRDVLRGLHAIHASGWIHADIKPGNILWHHQGHPVIIDASLAAPTGHVFTNCSGTPGFAAPEQINKHPIGPYTDIFACGVLLHYLITGGTPWSDTDPVALMADIARRTTPPLLRNPWAQQPIAAVIATALEPSIDRRYASAMHMADDITRILDGKSPHAAAKPAGRRSFLSGLFSPPVAAPAM